MHVVDGASRMWGYQRGRSCAWKDARTGVPYRLAAEPAGPSGGGSTVAGVAPTAAAAAMAA
jgi:hypothetical protein